MSFIAHQPPMRTAEPTTFTNPTSVLGRRVMAHAIDVIFLLGVGAFLIALTYREIPKALYEEFEQQGSSEVVRLGDRYFITDGGAAISTLGIAVAVLIIWQGLKGLTIGKLLTRLRCVKADGTPPGIARALVRSVLLPVDWLPGVPVTGLVSCRQSHLNRRVGDRVAGTYVIDEQHFRKPLPNPDHSLAAIDKKT